MDELQDLAEVEPDDERSDDRDRGGAELVRGVLDQHAAHEGRRLSRELVVLDEVARERGRLPLQVLDHHEERRDDGDQDVRRQEERLERAVDGLVAPPGADRDTLPGVLLLASYPVGPAALDSRRATPGAGGRTGLTLRRVGQPKPWCSRSSWRRASTAFAQSATSSRCSVSRMVMKPAVSASISASVSVCPARPRAVRGRARRPRPRERSRTGRATRRGRRTARAGRGSRRLARCPRASAPRRRGRGPRCGGRRAPLSARCSPHRRDRLGGRDRSVPPPGRTGSATRSSSRRSASDSRRAPSRTNRRREPRPSRSASPRRPRVSGRSPPGADKDAGRVGGGERVRGGVRDDHDVSGLGGLLDRATDQLPKLRARCEGVTVRPARRRRTCCVARGEPVEHARDERPAALAVGDDGGLDAGARGSPRDDLLVDEPEPEGAATPRERPRALRSVRSRDAYDPAIHAGTLAHAAPQAAELADSLDEQECRERDTRPVWRLLVHLFGLGGLAAYGP